MRIQERYVHASTGFLERAETLEHPVQSQRKQQEKQNTCMRERTLGLLSGRNMPLPRVSSRSYQLSGQLLL